MILYYGADASFANPRYNFGNASNDYGLGFYLTPDKEMARLWAEQYKSGGQVVSYDLELEKLNVCKLEDASEENILQWITLLTKHRFSVTERQRYKAELEWLAKHYSVDLGSFDMVIGYRADDSYFRYSKDFVANEITIELLGRAMKLGKLGLQYVLISEKSFTHIKELAREKVKYTPAYENFRAEVLQEYNLLKASDDKINNETLLDLMRKYK